MNPSIKQEWLEALRSGQYKQGKHRLQNSTGGFCCLGVLCDIASRHGVGGWRLEGEDPPVYDCSASGLVDTAVGRLPRAVIDWAGLGGQTDPMAGEARLSTLNDCGHTFAEIADLIEKKL
jgi:hypothetical protein